jgi:hypothetical protein
VGCDERVDLEERALSRGVGTAVIYPLGGRVFFIGLVGSFGVDSGVKVSDVVDGQSDELKEELVEVIEDRSDGIVVLAGVTDSHDVMDSFLGLKG